MQCHVVSCTGDFEEEVVVEHGQLLTSSTLLAELFENNCKHRVVFEDGTVVDPTVAVTQDMTLHVSAGSFCHSSSSAVLSSSGSSKQSSVQQSSGNSHTIVIVIDGADVNKDTLPADVLAALDDIKPGSGAVIVDVVPEDGNYRVVVVVPGDHDSATAIVDAINSAKV